MARPIMITIKGPERAPLNLFPISMTMGQGVGARYVEMRSHFFI